MKEERISIDDNVAQQSQIIQLFLQHAKLFGIAEDPAPRIYENHDRISRTAGWATGIVIAAGSVLELAEFGQVLNMGYAIPVLCTASIAGCGALIWWRFGWSRRLYKKYRSAELRIMRTSALVEGQLQCKPLSCADWRGFSIARALWLWLTQDHYFGVPQRRITEFLCALGVEPMEAQRISNIINTSQFNAFENRELAAVIVREFGLPNRAAWALENLSDPFKDDGAHLAADGSGMHNTTHPNGLAFLEKANNEHAQIK